MIVINTAVLFASLILAACSFGTCQMYWLYLIVPVFSVSLFNVVKAIVKLGGRYRTLHILTAICTFFGLACTGLALFQLPAGEWLRGCFNASIAIVHFGLIYRNGVLYKRGLELDAKIQEWKLEMNERERHWAEMYK